MRRPRRTSWPRRPRSVICGRPRPGERCSRCVAGLAAVVWGSERLGIVPTKSPPLTPELLADRARQDAVVARTSGSARGIRAACYGWDWRQIRHFLHKDRSPERFDHLRDAPLSPLLLLLSTEPDVRSLPRTVTRPSCATIRRADVPGMAEVDLDPRGRLRRYLAVPPRLETGGPWPDPDWSPLFQAAEFDPQASGRSRRSGPLPSTPIARQRGSEPIRGMADLAVRVEAAAYHGRLVWFELIMPWAAPESTVPWVDGCWACSCPAAASCVPRSRGTARAACFSPATTCACDVETGKAPGE